MQKLYTCDQVAEHFQVKTVTVWGWIHSKKLPAIKLGKGYRIRESDLLEFEKSKMIDVYKRQF